MGSQSFSARALAPRGSVWASGGRPEASSTPRTPCAQKATTHAAALMAGRVSEDWPLPLWILLPPFLGAFVGWLLLWLWPALGIRLLPESTIDRRVQARARLAFLDEGVFRTRDRSGMLLFVALRERRALVLADEGISACVEPAEWQAIIDRLVATIRAGKPTAGMVEAIEACGRLLERQGPPARSDDDDELSDGLRFHTD